MKRPPFGFPAGSFPTDVTSPMPTQVQGSTPVTTRNTQKRPQPQPQPRPSPKEPPAESDTH